MEIIKKVFSKYIVYSGDELENLNHKELPWLLARNGKRKNAVINKYNIRAYYAMKALKEGMKTVENTVYKFSPQSLQRAQERLKERKLFKATEDNFVDYQKFVVDSYLKSKDSIKRAEDGCKIR